MRLRFVMGIGVVGLVIIGGLFFLRTRGDGNRAADVSDSFDAETVDSFELIQEGKKDSPRFQGAAVGIKEMASDGPTVTTSLPADDRSDEEVDDVEDIEDWLDDDFTIDDLGEPDMDFDF